MEHTLANLRATFLRSELLPRQPSVLAVFLGGSRLYAASEESSGPTGALSDWDGVIIVNTKHDIFALVNEHRSTLMGMLSIQREACVEGSFRVPTPLSPVWSDFDAVRFAGYDNLGAKRSVKILSLEYFSQSKTTLNILSNKDRRVYEVIRSGPLASTISYRVQQATAISDQLLILHDQWIYTTCDHQQNSSGVAFGVTADLIVSGACLLGRKSYGREIKQKILAYYLLITGEHSTFLSFAKSTRFSRQYIDWLTHELSELRPTRHARLLEHQATNGSSCSRSRNEPQILFCNTTTTRLATCRNALVRTEILPLKAYQEFERGAVSQPLQRAISAFTSNSTIYHVKTKESAGATTNIFCKQSKYAEDELQGAWLASTFYPRTAIPRMSTSGNLLYPFFSGTSESHLRLSYIRGGRRDCDAVETLLHVELVKAEDMLRAYRSSMTRNMAMEGKGCPNLQRFFHSRLVGNTRMHELYGGVIRLRGECIPLEKFLETPWVINGKSYSTLRESFDTALATLSPCSLQASSCPVAFGLGDAHGGNVMISPKAQEHSSRRYLFVDYEVAGFHPVLLDLAKPLYNDVFFETLYLDLAPGSTTEGMSCSVTGDALSLEFAPQVDPISQAILDIKLRYLIQPLCDEVRRVGGSLDNHVSILANALLLCATLTRSFAMEEAVFLRNFATGIILSKARNWREFAACLETLGFATCSLSSS